MAQTAAILSAYQQIQALGDEIHWFCPRRSVEDDAYYYQEDIDAKSQPQANEDSRASEVDAATNLKILAFEALQIFAFDGKDAAQYQIWLEAHLANQMQRCDVCIREFHRGRRGLKEKLNDIHDVDEVRAFLERFDQLNLRRIESGLATATNELENLPNGQRLARMLSRPGLFALFETVNCPPMYRNEELLQQCFDKPHAYIMANKFMKLNTYVPAMTQFLFGRNPDRTWWAESSWRRFKRTILATEFEWSVREPLLEAMARVQMNALEKEFLPKFWIGVHCIVQTLDRDLITHSLRAMDNGNMEADICRLALSHLQVDSDHLKSLLATVLHILKVSPTDFWEAMGTISPLSWIDQFFSSPALERLLVDAGKEKISDSPALDALFEWMLPFLSSIKPVNQAPACRSLLNRLLDSFQTDPRPQVVKTHCARVGLQVLAETFRSLYYDRSLSSSGVAATEAFEIAEQHINRIASFTKKTSIMITPSSEVFRQMIALDCKCVVSSFESLSSGKPNPQVSIVYHASIWRNATKSMDSGNITLAKNLLLATRSLVGLEKFVVRSTQTMPPACAHFNVIFESVCRSLCDMIERLNDFSPAEMESLFDGADSTTSVIVLLFASDPLIRDAAVELIKTTSGQPTRRDAVSHLLHRHLHDLMNALSIVFRQITQRRAFAPASNMFRLCTDIVDALFDSQDGLLRSEVLSKSDAQAVERFWQALWQVLTMIFTNTEMWSNIGHDKSVLMEFCRNAMEFAEKLFDQFGVLTGALKEASGNEVEAPDSFGRRLVEQPRVATSAIVKWLKLRDDFLVARSSALVCKLLVRLREFDTKLSEEPLQYVTQIAYGKSRTTLTEQQKAELVRALEQHTGRVAEVPNSISHTSIQTDKNQKREFIDLEKWHANAKASSSGGDDWAAAISAATPALERLKAQQATKKAPPKPLPKQSLSATFKPIDPSDFRKKRQQEMEEMKKKNAQAIALQKKRIAGEGSGLQGLGLYGKEHNTEPKGTGMMVSSDEESGEDDDSNADLDRELFGPSRKISNKVVGKTLTDEQARALKQQRQVPVKKQRLVRSARDMRARLAPDLSPLHKNLLTWEYFHDGNFPPNTTAQDYVGVVNSFRDPLSYQRTFQPLLILEAWNGFLKAREENSAKPYEIKIVNRSSVDSFLEISSTMSRPDAKDISEGDIILLSKSKSPATSQSEPHCLSRIFRISHKKGLVEISYRVMPGTPLVSSLVPNAVLYGLKIMSVVPLEREYGALLGLQYYDLCDEITKALPSPLLSYGDATLQPFMRTYTVNKAQAKAVKCAIDNDGFTLVQGPPGSGKTKTIVAIAGALLTDTLTGIKITQPQDGLSGGLAKKMLVCAPSNAAVDELVMRFKEGVKTLSNEHRTVNIVRLGRSDAINANVLDVTLEELVNKRLNITPPADGNARGETQKIMEEHKEVSEKLRDLRAQMDEADKKGGPSKELKEDFDTVRRTKTLLGQKIDAAKDNENVQSRQAEINKKKAQQQIIDEAHVICATLSGSGHDMFQNLNVEFETVIIDEAAQCVELSALIPLKYGCAKCILVGDPQQLPPTIFSKDAARFKYEQSLFVRMQANQPKDVHLLDTQYRMHPDISLFPSKTFYNGLLLDGDDMGALRTRPWHETALLSPFRFFDVDGQHQSAPRGHSLTNQAEINIAMKLYLRLTNDFKDYKFRNKIGIITPYKSQLRELKEQFRFQLGSEISDGIEFNTTDAFQGREAEIIIFSCVRASPSGGIGFLQDIRRMNVGLTRAKCSLWVLGNSQSLMKGEFWAKLVEDARSRSCYTSGDLQLMLGQPLQRVKRSVLSSNKMISKSDTAETGYSGRETEVKTETTVKHEQNTARSLHGNEMRKMSTTSQQANANGQPHVIKVPDRKLGNLPSKTAYPTIATRPIKRRLSTESTMDFKTKREEPQSAGGLVSSSNSDVEMTDADPSGPPSGTGPTRNGKGRDVHGSATNASSIGASAKSRMPPNNGSNTETGIAERKVTRPPPPMRKKKPADPFIRKKPRV